MSSVLSILILASAYGLRSVPQERTNPMATCGTTMWSIRLDLLCSAKKVLPQSCHVVATAKKLSCAVFLISLELLFSSFGLVPPTTFPLVVTILPSSFLSSPKPHLRLSPTVAWLVCRACRRCSQPSCMAFW